MIIKQLVTIAGSPGRLASLLGMTEVAVYKSIISGRPSLSMALMVESSRELGRLFTCQELRPDISEHRWASWRKNSTKLAEFAKRQKEFEAAAPWPDPESPMHNILAQQLKPKVKP